MDFAHLKNRIRRKNSDCLLQGEEILAAFRLLPLGTMKRMLISKAISGIAGGLTDAVYGPGTGAGVDQSLEAASEAVLEAAEKRGKTQVRAAVPKLPSGNIIFVITDRRYLIFRSVTGYVRVRYSFIAALPLSAIIDMRMKLGISANRICLTFADGSSVVRDLPYGQGKPANLIMAFIRVSAKEFPGPPPTPGRLWSIAYGIGRGLALASVGAVMVILLVLLTLHHLIHSDGPGSGSSAAPAWVSNANSYCRTVIAPALKQSGILIAATPAAYARAAPSAAEIYRRLDQYLLSLPESGPAQLAVLSMSADGDQVAKYEQAAVGAYNAGNGAAFNSAVREANSWAAEVRRIANLYGLYNCAEAG